jgi:hypothetical protein
MVNQTKYLLTYRCNECEKESAFAEGDIPKCRYCDKETLMVVVTRQEITPELLENRIRALSESMLSNLQQAYQQMTEDDKELFPEGQDAEKEMLVLLAKVKSLKDKIAGLELDDPDTKEEEDKG